MPSGFVDRYKGKGYQPTGWLQQIGAGGAVTGGGGQLNSTSAVSTSGGISLSTSGQAETTLMSFVLPAKTLDRLGRNILITAFGTFGTSTGTSTGGTNQVNKIAKLYFGSVSITANVSTTSGSNAAQPWWLQLSVFEQTAQSTSAGVQSVLGQTITGVTHGGCTLSTGAEITGLNSTIKLTGQSSAAVSVGDIIAYGMQVQGLN